MIFSNNSKYPIGLDISDLSLKLFQLNKIGDKIKIQAIGKVDLPKGLIEEGEIKNKEEVIKAINNLIAHPKFGRVSSSEVVACLPETKTFVKLIEIEKTPNDLADTIKLEIEKHIPMSINEIYFDWQVMEDFPAKQRVLIGAANKNIVDQYSLILDEAKLSVAALEIEPISICRSLLQEEHYKFKSRGEKNYGVIDIGAKRTSLTVYSKNTILFTVSMPISGEKITEKIAQTLKIENDQAEKAKIICGLDENRAQGIIKNILSDMIEDLIKKIKEALKFYQYHFPDQGQLNQIILCGGGANINNLNRILKETMGVEVIVGDPLTNLGEAKEKFSKILTETHSLDINLNKKTKEREGAQTITQNTSLSFATAIGLALRGVFVDE